MLVKFAFQEFLEDCKFRNTTPANIKNYKVLLGEFVNYLQEIEVLNVEEVTSHHIKMYLLDCQNRGNSAGSMISLEYPGN
ncbi:Phage integrase, N-terminal SAM-like domain [Salimicrobium album]|uniref:Phage integrase, N-terminal SAM-like domain n=1 Tax=Salimicrobium album TaxID=50717 RepID=A0A1H3H038_9BACI|nr:Phage integrase, N-terminal SAM-like domain [Salimicrobium album]